ncbi:pilus assembly protein [Massilia sp. Dwa41.01b]|uniref:TadE family protein n=1 Tax=unclassified Massilia TaxID=2609279 RepID=UPI0016022730|nr:MULTISPECIES: TadE family protein [unclassified Massilia]QNA88971.1 pilus assembly protein [Massilia sp. Dwa41.01b]QNA99862.1 pilus assembly protein [Massilia sp. Se16.2.3]
MSGYLNKPSHRQHGAAAVELALVLPILVVFFTAPLFFAIFFWHYTVVQKAAQDGARYLSTVSEQEMRDPALALAAANTAREIIRGELVELIPDQGSITVILHCGTSGTGMINLCTGVEDGPLPESVDVGIQFRLKDQLFGFVDTGRYGWSVSAVATVPYVSN